jgi:outer membrane protein assembly factor BamB
VTAPAPSRLRSRGRRLLRAVLVPVVVAGTTTLVAIGTTSPAAADTDPQPPVATPTVSADALPTVQINGVVYDQVIVGNRVYVTGEFTQARPAGAAAGTNQTPRSNILAYDLTTGNLITSWAPTLNAGGRAIVASADGTRIFVGGSFTQVNGANRYRVAALDATTGALVPGWTPGTNARVSTLAISGDSLYLAASSPTSAASRGPASAPSRRRPARCWAGRRPRSRRCSHSRRRRAAARSWRAGSSPS